MSCEQLSNERQRIDAAVAEKTRFLESPAGFVGYVLSRAEYLGRRLGWENAERAMICLYADSVVAGMNKAELEGLLKGVQTFLETGEERKEFDPKKCRTLLDNLRITVATRAATAGRISAPIMALDL